MENENSLIIGNLDGYKQASMFILAFIGLALLQELFSFFFRNFVSNSFFLKFTVLKKVEL